MHLFPRFELLNTTSRKIALRLLGVEAKVL